MILFKFIIAFGLGYRIINTYNFIEILTENKSFLSENKIAYFKVRSYWF